ncbi:MAG: 30S ribosomal protein S16 [Opitutales bacterium]
MALRIRLQRAGSTHAPVYRVVVAESTFKRDGRFVENLGLYSPSARGKEQEIRLKLERVEYWLSVGANPSDTVKSLIRAARKGRAVAGRASSSKQIGKGIQNAPAVEAAPTPVAEAAASAPEASEAVAPDEGKPAEA